MLVLRRAAVQFMARKQGGTTDYLIDLPLHRKLFLCKGFLLYPAQTTNRSNTMKKQSITTMRERWRRAN